MKAPSLAALALFVLITPLVAADEPPIRLHLLPTERTLHSQKWESVTREPDETGRAVLVTNAYTEIRSFLNRFDQNTEQYVPASEGIEIVNGFGVSRNTAYQLILSGNQNDAEGAVDILMPDGKRVVLQCVGLAYYEPETGNAVWIAEAKDSIGIVEGNTVTWRDAFDDVRASIRVEARLDAVEHDVLIEEQLPDPAIFGLNGKVRLQVWHQVLNVPAASVREEQVMRSDGIQEPDSAVDFGAMMLDRGMAFPVDAERWGMGGGNAPKDKGAVHVSKEWVKIQGFDWLIETLPLEEALPQMQELPEPAVAIKVDRQILKEKMLASRKAGRSKPVSLAKVESKAEKQKAIASLQAGAYKPTRGYLIDYLTRSTGVTNHRWQGDTVYYISGPVTCSGTNTVFEAGTVLKYASNASVTVSTPITWEATPYRPIVMTAKDDNSVGETISGSSGNPNSNYYANPALQITSGGTKLNNFRIAHAQKGVFFYDHSAGSENGISHAQFVHCDKAIQANGYGTTFQNFYARNVLMTDCATAFYGYSFNGGIEHLTLSQSTRLGEDYNGQTYGTTSSLLLTNSVLVNVASLEGTRPLTRYGDQNGFFNCTPFGVNSIAAPSNPLQTRHAGAGYLATDSSFRYGATKAIQPSLKADLAKMTTYPPTLLSSDFTTSTTLAPVVPRGGSSLGYHYDPIDYLWTSLRVTNNSTLRLTNGVAIAGYGPRLLWLFGTSSVVSEGKPTSLNKMVTYNAVQEQPGIWITNTWYTVFQGAHVNLRFTDVSLLGGSTLARRFVPEGNFNNTISIRDSQLRGAYWSFYNYSGSGAWSPKIEMTNNVLERCTFNWSQGYDVSPFDPYYLYLTWRNNLFQRSALNLTHYSYYYGSWDFYDNLFDNCSISLTEKGGSPLNTANYNGFISTSNPLGGANNKPALVRDFVAGPLGPYYYPSTGATNSLASLIDSGSRTNAGQVGLYHYTNTRDQSKEAGSPLNIGFHYVALDKVQFVKTDYQTSGNWKGAYGQEGFNVIGDALNYPSYASVGVTGGNYYLWSGSTADGRALQKDSSGRVAACWYSGGTFNIILTQNDAMPHRVAIYCLDWDNAGRSQTISIKDTTSGYVYDSRNITGFYSGQYYIWDIVGDVTISVTRDAGANAVISGIFLGPGSNWSADGDDDGAPDYLEDYNGNGVINGGESDWTDPDSDDDGILDGWEILWGMNPLFNELNSTSVRLNYDYDLSGRLRNVSGLWSKTLSDDQEANVTSIQP